MGQSPVCKGEAPALSFCNSLSFKPSLASTCTESKTQAGTSNLGVTDTCQFLPLHFGPSGFLSLYPARLATFQFLELLNSFQPQGLCTCCFLCWDAVSCSSWLGPSHTLRFKLNVSCLERSPWLSFLSGLHPIIFLKKKKKSCEKVYTSSEVHKIIYA